MDRDPFSFKSFRSNQPTKKSANRKPKGFVQPRQVEDRWNFYRKSLYIAKPGRGWPAWLIPLVVLILIITGRRGDWGKPEQPALWRGHLDR